MASLRRHAVPLAAAVPGAEHPAAASPDAKGSEPSSAPRAWWQWFLVYPTLLVALVGAVPTVIELVRSAMAGVSFGDSKAAHQQQDLWTRNLLCVASPTDGVVNAFNVHVDATICKSGDVLVRFVGPNDAAAYRWVPVATFSERKVAAFSFFSEAMAQGTRPSTPSEDVMCQWAPSAGWVIRRVRDKQSHLCFNERIRTYTGDVSARKPVACNATCSGDQ